MTTQCADLARTVIARGHHDTCDFVKFDTSAYACTCGVMKAYAVFANRGPLAFSGHSDCYCSSLPDTTCDFCSGIRIGATP